MSITDRFASELDKLPAELAQKISTSLQQFEQLCHQKDLTIPAHEKIDSSLVKVWCCSEFVLNSCLLSPELMLDLIDSGDLFSAHGREQYGEFLQQNGDVSETELIAKIRHFRRREMVRIAWRDLADWGALDETLLDLTALAETCIQVALHVLYQHACERFGTPVLEDGTAQQLVVLGMGKLGAWELNYSSDIDLIFAFAQEGVLKDRKATSYGEFFTRLCRKLVKMLDEITVDGFVFRTDTRLRPHGESGPMVMNFDGMEAYYFTQAREWERYAMVKARQVAGDANAGPQLMAMLKPFVYRNYLDYGVFDEIRLLKFKINEELQRKDRLQDIKLGPGGIREIEFIGQAYQLVHGGRLPVLQCRSILQALQTLSELDILSAPIAKQLIEAYIFLRRVENHIQEYQDKQTHVLPDDEQTQYILAMSLGFENWSTFYTQLQQTRSFTQSVFDNVFSITEQQKTHEDSMSIWIGAAADPILYGHLMKLGYEQPEQILDALRFFKKSNAMQSITVKGARAIDRLIPQLLEAMLNEQNPVQTLKRVLALFEAISGRVIYLSLLSENTQALEQLIKLSAASLWISDYLSRYPMLFDELLDHRTLYEPLTQDALSGQLAAQLAKVDVHDEEQIMYQLRKFKQINVLRVAAADIMDVISLMRVSDYLTYIAEVILHQVVNVSWQMIVAKYGVPPGCGDNVSGFAVIGFGKLGGYELGYGSDLDMVFLYECENINAMTDGKKSISTAQFYTRLGQKVMHLLQTKMLSGILYEADMRLRPSGNSGLLVTHISGYEDYLRNNAWTWEHQALLRARFISGDAQLKNSFDTIRKTVLTLQRDLPSLQQDVREMREKMRDNLAVKDSEKFDIKQSKGGIADIEFIVQFNVLLHAAENSTLVTYTDNVRLLESLHKQGYISAATQEILTRVYCIYRNRGHRQALQGEHAIVSSREYGDERKQVEKIWYEFMQ